MNAKNNEKVRKFEKVLEIIESFNYDRSKLITILQKVQDEYRYLPEEVLVYIATALKVPVAEVYGVATFYAHFTLTPKGKYVVKVCDGTACHVKGSKPLISALQKKLGLKAGEHTTSDMMFTLETVSCLGACGLAPVMLINEQVFGQVTNKKVPEIIDKVLEEEAVSAG
jgi:NADH-quinone oxidoreductase subunit E